MTVDLTHSLHAGVTVYPGTMPPTFEQANTIDADGFAEMLITMYSHTGTHIDAPCHVIPGARSLDRFRIDHFVGRGTLIDVRGSSDITLGTVEEARDRIGHAEFVIFRTGWQDKWGSPAYFEGFPALTAEAAEWLSALPLKAVGFDAISADPVSDDDLPNHHLLLGRDILIVENLTNLDRLSVDTFDFYCLPLNIVGADGSPVRAFATLPDQAAPRT